MRVRGACKLLVPGALLLAMLAGCPLRPPAATAVPATPAPATLPPGGTPQRGQPYDVDGAASLLTVLVYRGGALASVGHNHVIASHQLSGTFYVPDDVLHSSFELHVAVDTLTVDEAALRAQQSGADFPAEVSEGARQGTRRNMLGEALLDAVHNPEIVLRSAGLERGAPASAPAAAASGPPAGAGSAAADALLAQVQSTVRGQQRTFAVPLRYQLGGGTLIVSGETSLRQSELGLTPFSAMLGALQVQDEMHVAFRIVARAAPVQ